MSAEKVIHLGTITIPKSLHLTHRVQVHSNESSDGLSIVHEYEAVLIEPHILGDDLDVTLYDMAIVTDPLEGNGLELVEDADECQSIAPWPDDNDNPVRCAGGNHKQNDPRVMHGGNGWSW